MEIRSRDSFVIPLMIEENRAKFFTVPWWVPLLARFTTGIQETHRHQSKSKLWLTSRHSPRYRKIATTTTTTITTTTTFPVLLNLGLMDFDINFWDGDAHVYVCPLERGCSVVSEARQVTLDSWKFSKLWWSSWKLIGLKTEELLIHSERFVDYWIEETFVWICGCCSWLISL